MRKENAIYQVWIKNQPGYVIALVKNGGFYRMIDTVVDKDPIDESLIIKYEYLGENK